MLRIIAVAILYAGISSAALTREQKLSDFRNLADLLAKRYAFADWKRQAIRFDPFDIAPWLDRVSRTTNDVEFLEVMVEYVAALKDGHSGYFIASTFRANLGFMVDLYGDQALVDSIDRTLLPQDRFPFAVGDELVSIDGKSPQELMQGFAKYIGEGNPRLARRSAADMLTFRLQSLLPRAHEIPDEAQVQIRRENGEMASYTMSWNKRGTPLISIPPSPTLRGPSAFAEDGLNLLAAPKISLLPEHPHITGIGQRNPIFALPAEGFQQRAGVSRTDPIVSGIFTVGEKKIGYVRVPTFSTSTPTTRAIAEIQMFKSTTDALIVDLMRNPGGNVCVGEILLSAVMRDKFKGFNAEIQFTWNDYLLTKDEIERLRRTGGPQDEIAEAEALLSTLDQALSSGKSRTSAIAICGATDERSPLRNRETGDILSYDKPVILLVDDASASTAEIVAALFQDAGRGIVVGTRTAGAGGSVTSRSVGIYSEGGASYAITVGVRSKTIASEDLPAAPYIENIGVRPDVTLDYMTRDNLFETGKPFLTRLLEIAVEQANKGQ